MKKISKAFKFRIYPTREQEIFLSKQFGATRFIYNYFLNKKKEEYSKSKTSSNFYKDCRTLTELKIQKEYSWLYDINSQTLQASLKNLDTAYVSFFRGLTKFPKFHSKKRDQSIKITQRFSIEGNFLYIIPSPPPTPCQYPYERHTRYRLQLGIRLSHTTSYP